MNKDIIANELSISLLQDFVSVCDKNPVLKDLDSLSFDEKLSVLGQYSVFPKNIISMLVSATYSLSHFQWTGVVEELIQNINEEMGQGDGKIAQFQIPHYTILRKVFKQGFDIDINNIQPKKETLVFVQNVKNVLSGNSPETVCGAVYALESSAIPELSLVKAIVLSALDDIKQSYPSLMIDFFDWHINDIEIAHRDRLLEMVDKEINDEEGWVNFSNGFKQVMFEMDKWWTSLSQ